MTGIYLIRHAEAEGNLYRICQGHYNSTITLRGYQQLHYLRERFMDIPVDVVYSSDLLRANTTASAIYLPHQLPVHLMPQLREISMGSWEKQSWGDLAYHDAENYNRYNKAPHLFSAQGSETLQQVQDRLYAALCQIVRENEGKTIVVTSHGAALRVLLGRLQGLSMEEIAQTPYGSNTAVSYVEWDGEVFHVIYRDDVSHLPGSEHQSARPVHEATSPSLRWMRERWGDRWEITPLFVDTTVGKLTVRLERGSIAIVEYEIFPAFRGNGLGIQLLGQAIQIARDHDRDYVTLNCPTELAAYFKKYGFAGDGETLTLDVRRIMREIP